MVLIYVWVYFVYSSRKGKKYSPNTSRKYLLVPCLCKDEYKKYFQFFLKRRLFDSKSDFFPARWNEHQKFINNSKVCETICLETL